MSGDQKPRKGLVAAVVTRFSGGRVALIMQFTTCLQRLNSFL